MPMPCQLTTKTPSKAAPPNRSTPTQPLSTTPTCYKGMGWPTGLPVCREVPSMLEVTMWILCPPLARPSTASITCHIPRQPAWTTAGLRRCLRASTTDHARPTPPTQTFPRTTHLLRAESKKRPSSPTCDREQGQARANWMGPRHGTERRGRGQDWLQKHLCRAIYLFIFISLMFFSFILRFLCLPLLFLGSTRHNFQSFQYLLTKAAFSLKRYTSCGSTQMLLKLFSGRFVGI